MKNKKYMLWVVTIISFTFKNKKTNVFNKKQAKLWDWAYVWITSKRKNQLKEIHI